MHVGVVVVAVALATVGGYTTRSEVQLSPGESARLEFKAAEMNDVLKSLTVKSDRQGTLSQIDDHHHNARDVPHALQHSQAQ